VTNNVDPRIDFMFRLQEQLQHEIIGLHPSQLDDDEKMGYIREQALALLDEVHEALGETGWKSWASSNHINRDAYVSELAADAMRFLINLLLVAGVTPSEFFQTFVGKASKVMDRATNGYDGVTEKCPHCKRDLNDRGVRCYKVSSVSAPWTESYWCDTKKEWYNREGQVVILP
jgi:hypothetical protein